MAKTITKVHGQWVIQTTKHTQIQHIVTHYTSYQFVELNGNQEVSQTTGLTSPNGDGGLLQIRVQYYRPK